MGALVLGCWVLGAAPGAQVPAQPPSQVPTFQSTTQVVEVDVRVFDRDGRFIEDLTLDDFEVIERGIPQTVRALYFVGPASTQDDTAPLLAAPRWKATGAPAPPVSARHTWIFVFDLNHLTTGAGFDRARQAVTAFLRTRFRDGDVGGIVAGTRMVNNRLTSVRDELEAAAAGVRPTDDHRARQIALTREWPRVRDEAEALAIAAGDRDAIQRAVLRAAADDPSAGAHAEPMVRAKAQQFRTEMQRSSLDTLTALQGLAAGLARVPGPKTVVLLSNGFVTQEMEATLRSVVGQTTRAGARIYAVDVRGLNRGTGAGIGDQMLPDSPTGGPARFDLGEDAPNSLAVDTGGFVVRNENNIGRALTTIAEDANRYYVIAYEPDDVRLDGQFRPIEVRVRRPGVTVRARRGYLALPASQLLLPQPVKRQE